ncbi:hypothetical protein DUT91_00010 [Phyllobacterium salinisoli]|uniref:Type VI secretion system-associated protein TagO n=1 Tax=Phyllobacterium salinisoli TaxID=1899321 RepID=A0A368K9T1_9HYPH|nr:type VI secretion system-associated protein TagO [Phyllobacterium salinisoli]RCS25253.1 hypothetical protein DUT91_00010 [Phyllobacterium salinisoli]
MERFRSAVAAAVYFFAQSAIAQDSGKECAAIEDAGKRLLCYDGVFRTAIDVQSPTRTTGKWAVSTETSKITDTVDHFISLESDDAFPGKYGRSPQNARLLIRCMESKSTIYFNFGDHFLADIQGYGDITFRVDERKAEKRGFDESTDHSALGLWSGGTAIPFVKKLIGGKKLVVRATPYNESPITATFDLRGMDEAIKPLRAACKW